MPIRNRVAKQAASLLRKGGAHRREPSSARRQGKHILSDQLNESFEENQYEVDKRKKGDGGVCRFLDTSSVPFFITQQHCGPNSECFAMRNINKFEVIIAFSVSYNKCDPVRYCF